VIVDAASEESAEDTVDRTPFSTPVDASTEITTWREKRKSGPHCSMGREPVNRRSGRVRSLCQPKLRPGIIRLDATERRQQV
jgi:hypothetical protein